MLTEGQWYSLPDGTAVQVCGPGGGTWHLMAADGTPAYVVFGSAARGFQIRRLVYTASVADDSGAEGNLTPVFQAVACDLTLEDLRLATDV